MLPSGFCGHMFYLKQNSTEEAKPIFCPCYGLWSHTCPVGTPLPQRPCRTGPQVRIPEVILGPLGRPWRTRLNRWDSIHQLLPTLLHLQPSTLRLRPRLRGFHRPSMGGVRLSTGCRGYFNTTKNTPDQKLYKHFNAAGAQRESEMSHRYNSYYQLEMLFL